jgi:hypothetical protein
VKSRNSYGFSDYSQKLTILFAIAPDAPTLVNTTNSGTQVIIEWSEPESNGSPITEYKVFIQEHNSDNFTKVDCANTSARVCNIELSALQTDFNLTKEGESVNVKIVAINAFGESRMSAIGSGAVI